MPPTDPFSAPRTLVEPGPTARRSCRNIECGDHGIGRKFAMGDPIGNNLSRGRFGSLNGIEP